jgi:hypothetical protein
MMRKLLFVALAACGSSDATPDAEPACVPDAMHRCVTWKWSFIDYATAQPIECPPEITGMRLRAEFRQNIDSSEVIEARGDASATCAEGSKTFLVQAAPVGTSSADTAILEALAGDRVYARQARSLIDGDEHVATISNDRGYVHIGWTLYSTSQARTLTCAEASQLSSVRRLQLTTTNTHDLGDIVREDIECDPGEAVSAGRHHGSYRVRLGARMVNGTSAGEVDAGTVTISDGQIADAGSVTLTVR